MATIKEILTTIKVGEPITNKRILNYFKKRGFIWDYSQYGYLEGISLKDINGYSVDYDIFANGTAKEIEKFNSAMWYDKDNNNKGYRQSTTIYTNINSMGTIYNTYGRNDYFIFDKYEFRTKYVSGCFKPYLIINKING